MTISFILKRSKAGFSMDDSLNGVTIYVRLRDGRLLDSTASTGETVNPLWWDDKREEIKANIVCYNKEKAELNEKLQDLKKFLYSKHKVDKEKGKVNKEWLAKAVKEYAKELGKMASRTVDKSHSFSDRFQKFLDANEFSEGRINQYRVIERAVLRFEEFIRTTKRGRKNFTLMFALLMKTTSMNCMILCRRNICTMKSIRRYMRSFQRNDSQNLVEPTPCRKISRN